MRSKKRIIPKEAIEILNPLEDARQSMSNTVKMIMGALTMVSALAWNEAIKGIFEQIKNIPVLKNLGFLTPFVYAVGVTLVTVYIVNRLQRVHDRMNPEQE